jgi:hypothetical protein
MEFNREKQALLDRQDVAHQIKVNADKEIKRLGRKAQVLKKELDVLPTLGQLEEFRTGLTDKETELANWLQKVEGGDGADLQVLAEKLSWMRLGSS